MLLSFYSEMVALQQIDDLAARSDLNLNRAELLEKTISRRAARLTAEQNISDIARQQQLTPAIEADIARTTH